MKYLLYFFLAINSLMAFSQNYSISGSLINGSTGSVIHGITVELEKDDEEIHTTTDSLGKFIFSGLKPGEYDLEFESSLFEKKEIEVEIEDRNLQLGTIRLKAREIQLSEVTVSGNQQTFGLTRLKSVDGVGVYDGKKNEVIVMKEMNISLATNSSRQIFSKVPGINIWESDAAGLQLGIATRGLDPNRTANFNTRQNGYDMAADALGYPESYYVPPAEAISRIEVVRGAASLQYGPQFGGMLNYVLNRAPVDKKIEWESYTTAGAYKLLSTYNSLGGTVKRFRYFSYYNYKQGNSWRPNGDYKLHNAFARIEYLCSEKLTINGEYTFSRYVAHQPGGLTDAQFEQDPKAAYRTRNWFSATWNILALSLDYEHNPFHRFNVRSWGFLGSRNALGYLGPPNRKDDITQNRDFISDQYKNFGLEARYVWKYYLRKSVSSLLLGARYYMGETRKGQGYADNGSDPNFNFISEDTKSSDYRFPGMNIALFTENVFNIANKVQITPGIRFEHISTKANGHYRKQNGNAWDSSLTPENRSFKRSFILFGLGLSYHCWKNTELYSNFSLNYRGITFTDMRVVRVSQVIDPNLKDETGFNLDLGYRGQLGTWFNFDVSGFWLQYNNRIGPVQMADSAYNILRYTTNLGTSRSLGAEIFFEADFFNAAKINKRAGNLVAFISCGYTNAIYTKSNYKSVVGSFLEFAPQLSLRGGITYVYKKFSTTVQGAYTSSQYTDASNAEFTPTAINGLIPAYYVMDWSAKYSIRCVQLMAGINNFTNNKYFTRRAVSYPGPGIIPAEALTFYFTLGIKLNEKVKASKFHTY